MFSTLTLSPMGLVVQESEPVPLEDQQSLLTSLQESLKKAEERCTIEAFIDDEKILYKLWKCRSRYMLPAAEALANGSRNAPWRILYGQAGILDFFLRLVASKEAIEDELLLHSLRLVGNSCADTNENREILVKNNYTSAIIRHLANPKLIQVAIPVLYNICIDFEPAQSQIAANKIVYIFLRLLKDNAFAKHPALLDYFYELIDLGCSKEDMHALAQARLKINQTLAEVSALPLFAELYPLDSDLDQLQICSCVVLGNLARSDAVCEEMVEKLNIHKALISLLKSEARGAVLHSVLGFLKNLAIAGNNKARLGEAGLIPAVSGLWQYETVPQVQFVATSITRQVIISSAPTYLSLLLALFEKTDSAPIKTEIGRIVASICRTLVPRVREKDSGAEALLRKTFELHDDISLPVVVRSEGWFTLALMASTQGGLIVASKLLAADSTDSTEADNLQLNKDRGNIIVLMQELLKSDLAEEGDGERGKTSEMQMLEVSRREIQKKVDDEARGLSRLWQTLVLYGYRFVYDPIATGFRFVHLLIIFLPVVFTAPILCLGGNGKNREAVLSSGTIWWYKFLVRSMERAGPAFIKLGQWAASRTDIFPPDLCDIMSSLHSNAPAHSLRQTKKIISKAFNNLPFEDIFEEFYEEPLGVGAIAQVYKAKLKPNLAGTDDGAFDGQPSGLRGKVRKNVEALVKSSPQRVPSSYVAVKVLHPKVERMIHRDLKIMSFFASLINAIPTMHWLSLPDEVNQFGEMMKLQLDLRIEAANLVMFREKFRTRTTAWFPYPYIDYSTREVLVEEFAQGIPLSTFLDVGGGVYQREIANEGLDAFLHMLLIDNFVHADLHPGNIMVRFYQPSELDLSLRNKSRASDAPTTAEVDVTESVLARLRPHAGNRRDWESVLDELNAEGYRPQLIFIDTGLVTQLNDLNRRNFIDLFRAIAEFDGYRAGELMVERCRQPEAVIDPHYFALRMEHLVLNVKSRTFALGSVKIGDVLSEVLSMVRSHHVRMEGDFVNVVISCLLLEGIGRNLDPDLDLFKSALPILRKLGSNVTSLKSVRSGDVSMLRIWVGLEARELLQSSIDSVEQTWIEYEPQ
ncbi:ubiquinone biosynthesis protein [Aspergillus indologenus CBS 114.80]|uniref:Ubiquinone biosynthesis protein n=1 Tax=Aspergillus indologenus CBS 114.80 TaxID=1450541 RepID=A0A2V5I8H0_9EURO|nr:ubiquinone biosynthesis protein [Aspergillus indologenus CBS 114.80]